MINIFLQAVYLYDDKMTLILNGGERPLTIDNILLDEIEGYFEGTTSNCTGCSSLVAVAPPTQGLPKTDSPSFYAHLRSRFSFKYLEKL